MGGIEKPCWRSGKLVLRLGLWYARIECLGTSTKGRIVVTRMRAGFTFLISAAFLVTGTPVALALTDPAAETATGTTGAASGTMGAAAGTTGAQQSTTCPTPVLKGLPKTPKFTNATINFKLTNMTVGSAFMLKAGDVEVYGNTATASTVKDKFQLPHQGATDRKIMITAIIDVSNCENAPWKLQKAIKYNAVTTPAPATPGATPAAGAPAAAGTPTPGLPVPAPAAIKPPKLPKPLNQRLPNTGPPKSTFAWMTPIDAGAQLEQKLAGPKLSPLERKSDKANSGNALLGLGIVGGLLGIATIGGFLAFRHRDEVQFERAMSDQLKHLEEGDPGLEASEDPHAEPPMPVEDAPFADTPELADTETLPVPAHVNGASNGVPVVSEAEVAQHRAEVEAELQRILNEAGVQAELEGILMDARQEAERHGIALDPELIMQALCDEINGSARLSDPKRAELRAMFAEIAAEEAQHVPAGAETVPTQ